MERQLVRAELLESQAGTRRLPLRQGRRRDEGGVDRTERGCGGERRCGGEREDKTEGERGREQKGRRGGRIEDEAEEGRRGLLRRAARVGFCGRRGEREETACGSLSEPYRRHSEGSGEAGEGRAEGREDCGLRDGAEERTEGLEEGIEQREAGEGSGRGEWKEARLALERARRLRSAMTSREEWRAHLDEGGTCRADGEINCGSGEPLGRQRGGQESEGLGVRGEGDAEGHEGGERRAGGVEGRGGDGAGDAGEGEEGRGEEGGKGGDMGKGGEGKGGKKRQGRDM